MAGLKVVAVKTHADGYLDLEDLKSKAEKYTHNLAAFMVRKLDYLIVQLLISSKDNIPFDIRRF